MTVAEAEAQGITPRRGGTLTSLLTPEPPILIPLVNSQGPTIYAATKIYQGLLQFSPKMEPLPELAKRWELSPDGLVYTFHLQENVKFHDGQPFTADDVIFSIMDFAMTLSARVRGAYQVIDKAEAVDPLTVRITLRRPFDPFLLLLVSATLPIVPKHIYAGTEFRTNPANQTPIGTGPFRFVEWQRGNFIRLARFEQYWKPGQPYLDEIIFRIVPDGQSRALALQTGQAQIAQANDIEPFDIPRFREQKDLKFTTTGWEYFTPISFFDINKRVKPLDDARVRRAMAHAIDRKFITDRLWFGVGKPASGPFVSSLRFRDPGVSLPDYDPKQAIALLDAAGLKPDAKGIRFTIRHMPLPYGEVWTRLSEYFRTCMQRIGVAVSMDSSDAGGWAARVAAWDYDTTVNFTYQLADPAVAVEQYYLSSNIKHVTFTNTGGYANPRVDALFDEARYNPDQKQRQAAYSEVQKILVEDMPYLYIQEMAYPTFYSDRLQNMMTTSVGVHTCFDDVFLT
jgi:peptide/nickel transport system substrate-binding protein